MHTVGKVDRQQIDYTSYASAYDAKRHRGKRNAYFERIQNRALLHMIGQDHYDRRVLDVGCGTGRGLLALGRAGFTNLTGLDYTPAMLEIAAQELAHELPTHIVARIRLMQGDAFTLPFADASFDVVVSLNFLHMFRFDLQEKLLCEMTRVCVPNGLVISEFESLHKGLFFTRFWEQRRLRHRTKFNSFLDIRRLFDRQVFEAVRVVGLRLPKAHLLFRHFPRAGEYFESITYLPPFNWMAQRVMVAGQRLDRNATKDVETF
jgi:ubiquinone/menaquinone biosynthesis C-methylase UbiE